MTTIAKLFLVMALFTGTVMAGDQPNGGYTGCTVDCPPPCTENCDPENGLSDQDATVLTTETEADADLLDSVLIFAAEWYQMFR